MGWTIVMLDQKGEPVKVVNHKVGTTIEADAKKINAEMDITYNYSLFFYDHLDPKHGLRWLHGKKGEEVSHRLATAIRQLGTNRHPDQWKKVKGNAGFVLYEILSWAKQYPKARFFVFG